MEQQTVLATLHDPRFMDLAPSQIYARLLEEGHYLCSIRTMYRLLTAHQEVQERRAVASHPVYTQPELLATKPNEVWSWDITKLKGPVKWTYYYLYVILDIFSRYVVGWMSADFVVHRIPPFLGNILMMERRNFGNKYYESMRQVLLIIANHAPTRIKSIPI